MVGTLIESRAQRQRRRVGSVASIVLHAALIGAAVIGTARESISAVAPPVMVYQPIMRAPPPETPRRATSAPKRATADILTAPAIARFDAPILVPTGIPPIDLSAVPTPSDFNEVRGRRGMLCDDPCPRVGLGTDGTGEMPVWAVNDVMMQLREQPVPPRYPERLRQAGVDGNVLVKFVVDTLGRVDMGSIEVLRSSHDLFAIAVRESLGKMRFNPAVVGSRKIPASAMMPFQFTLK